MKSAKYNYDLLCKHSNETALFTRRTTKNEFMAVRRSFGFLSKHFALLENQPKTHERNVKMALTSRFTNHLFSHVLLAERGLLLDAINCGRSATETLAFYWLVCRAPLAATDYESEASLRPVEVRKRLEGLGVDVSELRDQYGFESTVSHVGNKYDNLQIKWGRAQTGELLIGGGGDINVRRSMLGGLPKYIALFVLHDPNYSVKIGVGTVSVAEKSGCADAEGEI